MKENNLEIKKENLVEVNPESDKECIQFHVKRDLEDIYKRHPYLFNKWIGLSTQTWEGSMEGENGKEIGPSEEENNPLRFSSELEIFEEVPPKGFKFDKNDLNIREEKLQPGVSLVDEDNLRKLFEENGVSFDPTKKLPTLDILSENILRKNSDKLLSSEAIPEQYFKEVAYRESTHYHGLSFLALKGKVYNWSKDTTLGDLLKKLEAK